MRFEILPIQFAEAKWQTNILILSEMGYHLSFLRQCTLTLFYLVDRCNSPAFEGIPFSVFAFFYFLSLSLSLSLCNSSSPSSSSYDYHNLYYYQWCVWSLCSALSSLLFIYLFYLFVQFHS